MPTTITSARDLRGVFPALFTPLKNDDPKCLNNTIDYDKAKIMIDDLIETGVTGIVPVGTTGQSATVTPHQHIDFIQFTIDYIDGRVPVIAGAGSNCTRESINTIQKVQKSAGELTCLCVTGYYNNPPQPGLIRHFETIVQETGANIVVYNVPSRTMSYLEPDTIIQLSENKNIIGLKQAVDFKNPGQKKEDTLKIARETNPDTFAILSGEDDSLYTILTMGGKGMITASGNIPEAAALFLKCLKAFEAGDREKAAEYQNAVIPYVTACFLRKNPIPLAALFNSPIYLPMVSAKDTEGGETVHRQLMELVKTSAPKLQKYH